MNQFFKNKEMQKWAIVALRVALGVIFLAHGWQKFYQFGFEGVAGFFGSLGIPAPMIAAVLVTFLELVGGLALILGVFTPYMALLLAGNMLVAWLTAHLSNGIFVADNGFELVLILGAVSLFFAFHGAGPISVDAKWLKQA